MLKKDIYSNMGKFSQFTYWKSGVNIGRKKVKLPKDATEYLVYYQILNGEYDESPYWKMSIDEFEKLEGECLNWKLENNRSSSDAYDHWYIHRRRVYNKKIQKLREAHQNYEESRLKSLKVQLIKDFGYDIFDDLMDNHDGDLIQFYYDYKTRGNAYE